MPVHRERVFERKKAKITASRKSGIRVILLQRITIEAQATVKVKIHILISRNYNMKVKLNNRCRET